MCTLSNVKSLGAEMDPAREYLCSTDEPMFSQTSGLDKDAKAGGRDERREVLGNYPHTWEKDFVVYTFGYWI